jgi:beta-glucanase (GH16 family)
MHMIYDDEFNGSSLSSDWATCWWYAPASADGGCSNGTAEGEWYRAQNVTVHNGELSLTAQNQPVQGVNQSTGLPQNYNWTSGMVDTHGKFSFSYGYVEWQAQVPNGMGLWPALWLMPENGIWPPEIDALEMVGSQPNVWTGTYLPPTGAKQGHWATINGLYSGWHTFGVDWEPGSITWYVDGHAVAQSTTAVTNTPMYLVMDLAVGASWPGYPDASTPFPSALNIDYVRVWQQ